jgi:hypothetical protein
MIADNLDIFIRIDRSPANEFGKLDSLMFLFGVDAGDTVSRLLCFLDL